MTSYVFGNVLTTDIAKLNQVSNPIHRKPFPLPSTESTDDHGSDSKKRKRTWKCWRDSYLDLDNDVSKNIVTTASSSEP